MTVNVELLTDWEAVERDAAGALDRRAQPSLFDRLSWFRLLSDHCAPPGALLAARAAEAGERAWLFLARQGGKARVYTAWYSLRFGGIGSERLFRAIAARLREEGVTEVSLAPLESALPLRDAFKAAGWLTFLSPATISWRIATDGMDFDTYWAKRPGKLRSTAVRKAKAAGLDIAVHGGFSETLWADYEAVYAASWKGEEGSPAFLRALAEQEGKAGTLRLGIARKDGRPVAAQLWTVENGTAWIHKLAYAEDAKALSPGTVLSMEMFRHVLDKDRVRRIDYGTGDDAYKRDWMEERHTLWRLDAFNLATLAGLAGAARALASRLVARVRSG